MTVDYDDPEFSLDNVFIDSTATSNSIELFLRGLLPDDDQIFELYRADEYIGTYDPTYTFIHEDLGLQNNTNYTYKIVGKTKLSEGDIQSIIEKLNQSGIEPTPEEIEEFSYKPYEISKAITTLKADGTIDLPYDPTATYYDIDYGFRYKTFIPNEFVPALSVVQGLAGYQFEGDNRSFSFTSNKYRTKTDAIVNFTNGASRVSFSKDVGWSHLYDSQGNLKEARLEPDTGLKISTTSSTSEKISFKVTHSCKIPFGVSPAIDYYYNATVYKDGSFNITGSRDQAPSHEFYSYNPNSTSYTTLFKASNKGFNYLLPVMPDASIKVSK